MGSIIAETTQAEHIEHLGKRSICSGIFVSVGMLIDPNTVHSCLAGCDTYFGCYFWSIYQFYYRSLNFGATLKQSIQIGMTLAQIGEFSFIIATLGMSLNVTSDFLSHCSCRFCSDHFYHSIYGKNGGTCVRIFRKKLPRKWVKE
jgi:CPA2 family monovalent cation:H+ antiporter-2